MDNKHSLFYLSDSLVIVYKLFNPPSLQLSMKQIFPLLPEAADIQLFYSASLLTQILQGKPMMKALLLWFIKQTFYVFTVINFTNYWYGFKFSTVSVSAAKNFFNNLVIPLFSDILLNRDKIMVFYTSSDLGPIIYKDRQLCISSDTFLSISMTLLHLTFSYNKYNHLLFI